MKEQEYYNINFLLTNQNDQRGNQLLDSFINIYANTLGYLRKVECLNVSPNHHFMEEFRHVIENYEEVETYIASADKEGTLLIKGIRAINVLTGKEIPIYINPHLDYVDENVALFGISKTDISPDEDSETIFLSLNGMSLEIVDYGTIKGAERVLVKTP